LAGAGQEYVTGDDRRTRSLQTLHVIINVKTWEINQAVGRYIRAHENVQRISTRPAE